MWLLEHFMKHPGEATLTRRVWATKEDFPQKNGKSTTYCQVVNYLLATYATDDFITEIEADTTNFE